MNTLIAKTALVDILNAAKLLLGKACKIGEMITKAQAENRDVTQAEIDSIVHEDDAAKVAINAAILRSIH